MLTTVAGSHGFDIWSPEGGAIEREEGAGFEGLLGIFVGRADDPEVSGRTTAAGYVLHTVKEVERFLDTLAR